MVDRSQALSRNRAGILLAALLALAVGVAPLASAGTGLEEAARQQFLTSCGTCHAVERGAAPRQGPNLAGIFGQPAGKVDGFKYSPALAAETALVWDESTLERWIEDAQAMLPGTIMSYRQRDPEKRRLVIAYLKSLPP